MSAHYLHEHFARHARERPEAIALSGHAGSYSYAELDRRARRVATWLRREGVGPDRIVGLCLDWPPDQIAMMLAVLYAGGAWLPLDPALPPARLHAMVAAARPRLVLCSTAWRSALDRIAEPVHGLEGVEAGLPATDNFDAPVVETADDQLCYVMFTSGSTGEPKGVMVSHGNVAGLFDPFVQRFGLTADDSWSYLHSFGFGYSIWEIWGALRHGGRLVALPPGSRADPAALGRHLADQGVTVLSQTPSAFRHTLLDDGFVLPAGLRLVALSGEAAAPADLQAWFQRYPDAGPEVIETYAITETGGQVTCRQWSPMGVAHLGEPLPGVTLTLVDEHDQVADEGELLISGPGIARGYINDEALTAVRFVELTIDGVTPVRYYRSGDHARRLADGRIGYLGRSDGQIKWRGRRLETAEIESALQAHPGLRAAAVAVRGEGDQARLVGYIVPAQPATVAADDTSVAEFWPSVGPYQVYDSFLYDLMTAETVRLESYRQAFRASANGRVVLDIGTGEHAVLARQAVEAGARHVYAIEVLPEAAQAARELVAQLGLADRISVITGDPATVELPELAEIATQGIIGNIGSADGIVPIWNSARRHFAKECVPVPGRCRTYIAAAELPDTLRRQPAFGALAQQYAQRVFDSAGGPFDIRLCVRNFPHDGLLSAPLLFEDLDFSQLLPVDDDGSGVFEMRRAGRVDGFLLWTVVTAIAGEEIDYLANQQAWLPVFIPLPDGGVEIDAGHVLRAQWRRRTVAGLCPDYFINGVLRRGGDSIEFTCESRVQPGECGSSWLHRALLSEQPGIDIDGMRRWLSSRLPDWMLPTAWVRLDRLPLNSNGKLDRAALPAPSRRRPELASPCVPGRNVLERDLVAVWAQTLDLEAVGIHDNFFDLGGDSIAAVRLVSAMQRRFDDSLGLTALFDAPTVAELAAMIAGTTASAALAMEEGEL